MDAQRLIQQIPVTVRALLCAGLLAMGAESSRADTWDTALPMPTARSGLAATGSTAGSEIYALGGTGFSGVLNTMEIYDARARIWRGGAPMPTAREDLAAATGHDGTIYALGGKDSTGTVLDTVEAYHPSSGTWSPVARMPTARSALAAATGPDGKIYALGGRTDELTLNAVEVYDPSTNTWTAVAQMPTPRRYVAAATSADGKIYALGGSDGTVVLDTVEVYDPRTDTWTSIAPMSTMRTKLAAALGPDGLIYALGGNNRSIDFLDTVEAYHPYDGTWTPVASMPTARYGLAAATGLLGRIYAIGGINSRGNLNNLEVFGPSTVEGHGYAYVTVPGDGSVAVIELETNTVVAEIRAFFVVDVAISPDRTRAYLASSDGIDVIDTATDTQVNSVFLAPPATAVAFTPDGAFAYVTTSDPSSSDPDVVWVIDTNTLNVASSVRVGRGANGIAMRPNGNFAYVSNARSNSVSVIDTTTNPPTVVTTIDLGSAVPGPVTVAPDGTRAYVSSNTDAGGFVFEIDTTTHTLVDPPIDLGQTFLVPTRAVFSLDGSLAYVGVARNDSDPDPGAWLEVIHTDSRRVVDSLNLGGLGFFLNDVAMATDGSLIYLTGGSLLSRTNNQIWVVTPTLQVQAREWFPPGFAAFPDKIAIGPLPRPDIPHRVYVANSGSNSVSAINTDTGEVTAIVLSDPDGRPQLVAVPPDGKHAYVLSTGNGFGWRFDAIDTADNSVRSLGSNGGALGGPYSGITLSPPGGRNVYVAWGRPSLHAEQVDVYDTEFPPDPFEIVVEDNPSATPNGPLAYAPDDRVYVAVAPNSDDSRSKVKAIDAISRTVIATIPIPRITGMTDAQGVAITPDGRLAYVTATDRVAVIDTDPSSESYYTVVAWIADVFPLNPLTGGIAITPNGRFAYVTSNDFVSVIELATNAVTGYVPHHAQSFSVAINRRGDRAYVTGVDAADSGVVTVIDTGSHRIVDTLRVGRSPRSVAVR